ncbi:glucuronyl esterase domain-containing protein [Olivibacter domesticus]|uniref:4-O-methyl-glucuronoyl methylesterase-like domain-containing protein n=1 Tax=Olivibacter domesticus TaxID=407022 RepID=A0A1H7HEN3_OLID1|nr:hypothetical protein [Olivibacter domesticus]SEK48759.1 hypothetical protein SAMN05661044_00359 [Olivibacter domesticus]
MIKNKTASMLLGLCYAFTVQAQQRLANTVAGFPVNYSEAHVGKYKLPDPLVFNNGKAVRSISDWQGKRRTELLNFFGEYQFGQIPKQAIRNAEWQLIEENRSAKSNKAIRKQVRVYLSDDKTQSVNVLYYLPKQVKGKTPLLLHIAFQANNRAVADSAIQATYIYNKVGERLLAPAQAPQVPLDSLLAAGIGFATFYYGDIEPDYKNAIHKEGIRHHLMDTEKKQIKADTWGAIAAWAWGTQRIIDCLSQDPEVDNKRIALFGVSRLGKTALWTSASDSRIKLTIASCSGEGGAALSRREYGESISHMTDTSRYFYQFAPNRHQYVNNAAAFPVDAHELIALIAPRPLLLQTGDEDYWSDPKGEYLAAQAAVPVYQLHGIYPLLKTFPNSGNTASAFQALGYYMHAGGHGTIPSDWKVFIAYLQKFL